MTIQLNEADERPITPKEVRDSYLKYKDMGFLPTTSSCYGGCLEGCVIGGRRGAVLFNDSQCGLCDVKEWEVRPFVPLYEVRRIADRPFRRYLAEAQPLGSIQAVYVGQTDIADELSSMESRLTYERNISHWLLRTGQGS
jgi:hypothetical protein